VEGLVARRHALMVHTGRQGFDPFCAHPEGKGVRGRPAGNRFDPHALGGGKLL
jgi:hypothetical protein